MFRNVFSLILEWRIPQCLLIVYGLFFCYWETQSRLARIDADSRIERVTVSRSISDPDTRTGFSGNRQDTIVTERSDTYHWILNTQLRVSENSWRLRHLDYDNAPQGREVHWASLHGWWIEGIARTRSWFTDETLGESIAQAALYANPLLGAIALISIGIISILRFGSLATLWLVAGVIGLLPFREYLLAGNADHHGWVALSSATCLMLFMLGCIRSSDSEQRQGKALFIASGIAGGIALWVNAVSAIPIIAGINIAGAILAWRKTDFIPWRLWGAAGCATSVLAYLIEYAPSNLGLRLEVNHYLISLSWLGAASLLERFSKRSEYSPADWLKSNKVYVSVFAVIWFLPLFTILTKGSEVFQPLDPFLRHIHSDYITEFKSLFTNIEKQSPWRALAMTLPLLCASFPAYLALAKHTHRDMRTAAIVSLCVSALLLVATAFQARWWGLCFASLWLGMLPILANPLQQRFAKALCVLMLVSLLPGLVVAHLDSRRPPISQDRVSLRVAERSIAQKIRERVGNERAIALAGPNTTTAMAFFGNIHGLGTLYWENNDGLKGASEIFAAETFEEARHLIVERGITHIVLLSWDGFEMEYLRLVDAPLGYGRTFLQRILKNQALPAWLRPIPLPLPQYQSLSEHSAFIFEIDDQRSESVAFADQIEYMLEMGLNHSSRRLWQARKGVPTSIQLQIAEARLEIVSGNVERYEDLMTRIALEHRDYKDLRDEDRIRLAGMLAHFGNVSAARNQLIAIQTGLSEPILRKLTPSTLSQLLLLENSLGVNFKNEKLRTLAMYLLPPYMKGE